jgi:hypothetical protein
MEIVRRWCAPLCLLALILTARGQDELAGRPGDIAHMREELGVNEFTAPSIELLLEELNALRPIPVDQAWRGLPEASPQDRRRLALMAGQVIADGFLAISAEKQSRIEPVGRVLLKLARGLGVGDRLAKHSRSILEMAATQRWSDIRSELIKSQAEIEAGMIALKDEEIAHLVSLGGWLRGLEITSSIVLEDYTPERARRLIQPELFDYYSERVQTLHPDFKETELVKTMAANLKAISALTSKAVDKPITKEEVKQIRELAREINKKVPE